MLIPSPKDLHLTLNHGGRPTVFMLEVSIHMCMCVFIKCKSARSGMLSNGLRRSQHRYQILAAEAMEDMARSLQELYPDRFRFHPTTWGKFPDGTDNIEVGPRIIYS